MLCNATMVRTVSVCEGRSKRHFWACTHRHKSQWKAKSIHDISGMNASSPSGKSCPQYHMASIDPMHKCNPTAMGMSPMHIHTKRARQDHVDGQMVTFSMTSAQQLWFRFLP
eukprot:c6546_g1_i2 orf=139-474(-)